MLAHLQTLPLPGSDITKFSMTCCLFFFLTSVFPSNHGFYKKPKITGIDTEVPSDSNGMNSPDSSQVIHNVLLITSFFG